METKRFSQPILFTLVIAVIGIVAPIAWDLYKTKDSIELQHLSTTPLIEKSPSVDKLKIYYDNKEIESLSKIRFALVNTGKKPIIQKDLISPPTLTFPKEVNLLEFKIERLSPHNLEFQPDLNLSSRTIRLSFPLLNPSDVIEFSVLLSGSITDYKAEARIAGVKELKVIDRAKELERQPKRISWTVYFVGSVVIFLIILIVFAAVPEITREIKYLIRLPSSETNRLVFRNKSDLSQYLEKELPSLTNKYKTYLIRLVENKGANTTNEVFQKEIKDGIVASVRADLRASIFATVFILILTGLGFWYVLSHVL